MIKGWPIRVSWLSYKRKINRKKNTYTHTTSDTFNNANAVQKLAEKKNLAVNWKSANKRTRYTVWPMIHGGAFGHIDYQI